MAEGLLELSLGRNEIINSLRLGKAGLSEGKLSIIELDQSTSAHLICFLHNIISLLCSRYRILSSIIALHICLHAGEELTDRYLQLSLDVSCLKLYLLILILGLTDLVITLTAGKDRNVETQTYI